MKVVIPAGGLGRRVRSINPEGYPKAFLYYGRRTLTDYMLDIVPTDIDIIYTVKECQLDYFRRYMRGKSHSHNVTLISEPDGRFGFGGGVKAAEDHIGSDQFLIMASDGIFKVPFDMLGDSCIVFSTITPFAREGGVISVNSMNYIDQIIEKPRFPRSDRTMAGCFYVANPDLFWNCLDDIIGFDIRVNGEYQLTSIIQFMIERGEKIRYHDIPCVLLRGTDWRESDDYE